LGITKEEAESRIEDYFRPYPGVRAFIDDTHDSVAEIGEVYTIVGRKRRLPEAVSDWREGFYGANCRWVERRPGPYGAQAMRQSVNSRIQGSVGDILKLAQLRIEGIEGFENEHAERLRELGYQQLLQIHDEVLGEEPDEPGVDEEVNRHLLAVMENPLVDMPERLGMPMRKLKVPLTVDIGSGRTWIEAH